MDGSPPDTVAPSDLPVALPRRGKRKKATVQFRNPWFCSSAVYRASRYPVDTTAFGREFPVNANIACALVIDAEYATPEGDLDEPLAAPDGWAGELPSRQEVTLQAKSIAEGDPTAGGMFVTESFYHDAAATGREDQIRHPVLQHKDGFVLALEYLRASGEDIEYWRDNDAHDPNYARPFLCIVQYAHFAVADVPIAAGGQFQEDIIARFSGNRSGGCYRPGDRPRTRP
mgnify:CR=1 FL=1